MKLTPVLLALAAAVLCLAAGLADAYWSMGARRSAGPVLLVSLLLLCLPPSALAAVTFTVNSTASTPDAVPGDGICDDGTGACTWPAAVTEVGFLLGSSTCADATIELAVEGTIQGDAIFQAQGQCFPSIVINGPGSSLLVLVGNLTFGTSPGTTFGRPLDGSLSGLSIHGAVSMNALGSRVFDGSSHLELSAVEVQGGEVFFYGAGGLSISGSVIQNSPGPGTSVRSPFRQAGTLTIDGSEISSNTGDGVVVNFVDQVRISNSKVAENQGNGLTVSGDMQFATPNTLVTNSTFDHNGGAGFSSVIGMTVIRGSTFSRNGGGGISSRDFSFHIENSTISGNSTAGDGGGVLVGFGGMFQTEFTNVTIADNTADGIGGGINAVNVPSMHPTMTTASIIAGNFDSGGGAPDCVGSFTSGGFTLIGALSGCSLTGATGDLVGVDPLIGPLADNGGPTLTHALLAGSPAIDAAGMCSGTDQRGVTRPQGAACDIGAYESACGNGTVDPGEQCDRSAPDGKTVSCCNAMCGFEAAGTVCDGGACDGQGTCVPTTTTTTRPTTTTTTPSTTTTTTPPTTTVTTPLASTTTTISTPTTVSTSTTSTTVPGCGTDATFTSIICRLTALRTKVGVDVGASQFRHNLIKTLDRRAIWNVRQAQELAGEGDMTRSIVRLHRASRGLEGFTHRLDVLARRKRVSRAVAKPLGDEAEDVNSQLDALGSSL